MPQYNFDLARMTPEQLALLMARRFTSPSGTGVISGQPMPGAPPMPADGGRPRPVEPYGADLMPPPYKVPAPQSLREASPPVITDTAGPGPMEGYGDRIMGMLRSLGVAPPEGTPTLGEHMAQAGRRAFSAPPGARLRDVSPPTADPEQEALAADLMGAFVAEINGRGAGVGARAIPETAKDMAKAKAEIEARAAALPDALDTSALGKPSGPQIDLPRYDPTVGRGRGVSERVQSLVADPDVREQMKGIITAGRPVGDAWYDAGPLRDAFVGVHGEERGTAMFRKLMEYVAGTSPRSDVGTNIRNASYYFSRDVQGNPVTVDDKLPFPYGHYAQGLHKMNAQRIASEGIDSFDYKDNPKPKSFVENLAGNWAPVTVDTHALRLPAMLQKNPEFLAQALREGDKTSGFVNTSPKKDFAAGKLSIDEALQMPAIWESQPNANEYKAMEDYYKSIAQELGIHPAQAQASAWVGGGKVTGLESETGEPFVGTVNQRIKRTAAIRDQNVWSVLEDFIRGRRALLAAPPAAVAAVSGDGGDQ